MRREVYFSYWLFFTNVVIKLHNAVVLVLSTCLLICTRSWDQSESDERARHRIITDRLINLSESLQLTELVDGTRLVSLFARSLLLICFVSGDWCRPRSQVRRSVISAESQPLEAALNSFSAWSEGSFTQTCEALSFDFSHSARKC